MTDFASVCILSFNRPDFLRECVGSLYANAGAPFELIIHDDGSTDESVYPILSELASVGATVIVNKPGHNQGVGTAINRMFGIAKGDPLIKVDQDLIFQRDWLADLQSILDRNRRGSQIVGTEEPRLGWLGLLHYHHEPVDSAKTLVEDFGYWTQRTHILGSAFAYTREAYETFGPLEEHLDAFNEDWNRMQEIHASEIMAVGLPIEDLCLNRGFGIGPSTVVLDHDKVQSIHHGPYLHGVHA